MPRARVSIFTGGSWGLMFDGFARWRTITLSVSCLLHGGLAGTGMLAERWVSTAVASKPPVLAVELVAPEEAPPPEPPPPKPPAPRKPQPVPLEPVKLPKPIATPMPQATEAVPEPPTEQKVAPEPQVPAPQPPATPMAQAPAVSESVPAGRPTGAAAPPMEATTGPAFLPGPAETTLSGQTRASTPSAPAVAAVPSVEAGTTGAITQHARPRGGYQVRPSYPSSARRQGAQGTTLLRVHVLIDGRVGEVIVQESAGHPDLDQAAAGAVRLWRFEPARRGDEAVAMWVLLPVEFRLR